MPGDGGKGAALSPSPPKRPLAVGVDLVIFTVRAPERREELQVLLARQTADPRGPWALPGGLVGSEESLDDAARRMLSEETDVRDIYLEQLYTFGEPDRHPDGRVVGVSYFALIASGDAGGSTSWHAVSRLPPLVHDHGQIIDYAITRLRNKLEYTTVGFQLLPRAFTLSHLQRVYEVILDKRLDKRNFRRKMLSLGILRELDSRRTVGAGRPARLYAFDQKRFLRLKDKGILFPF